MFTQKSQNGHKLPRTAINIYEIFWKNSQMRLHRGSPRHAAERNRRYAARRGESAIRARSAFKERFALRNELILIIFVTFQRWKVTKDRRDRGDGISIRSPKRSTASHPASPTRLSTVRPLSNARISPLSPPGPNLSQGDRRVR